MLTIALILILAVSNSAYSQGSSNVTLLANVNEYPSTGYNECWGYTAPDGREYALLGVINGSSIIDITDTDNPNEVNFIPSPSSTWKDMKTYQEYAYVVVDGVSMGLQIIDLSDLPNSAPLISTYTGNGFGASHNIYIDEANALLYAQASSSVRILSLADPENPVQLNVFASTSTHDIYVRNNLAYISDGWDLSFSIFNVSEPASPQFLQSIIPASFGYAHNAWTSEDGNYLFTTEEVPASLSVKIWDISEIDNISLVGDYLASAGGRPHNVFVKGDYAYISHYWDGLRILDISEPEIAAEAGYYDTYPGSGGNYEGAWGTYPFFSSGKVLISDRATGLYVVYFQGAFEGELNNYDKSVNAGWNIVGLPNAPVNTNYQELFPGADENTLFSFDGTYQMEESLTTGKGYWLNFSESATVPMTGHELTSTTIPLQQGWNLISGVSGNVSFNSIIDPDGIVIPNSLFGFEGTYQNVDELVQGTGYWINADDAGEITIDMNASQSSLSSGNSRESYIRTFPALHIQESATDLDQTLYFGVQLPPDADLREYEMPPLGPEGVFDARFRSGHRISEAEEFLLDIQSVHYPIEISISNLGALKPPPTGFQTVLQEIVDGRAAHTHFLSGDQSIRITNPQVKTLLFSRSHGSQIPADFNLQQNYPNPFNPSTTIAFELPQESTVSLTVFNSAGQKVKSLVNTILPAGIHQSLWDGTDESGIPVSSGMYLYRVSATLDGSTMYSNVKRMTLIK